MLPTHLQLKRSSRIKNFEEYYNNFGDNSQNSTNSADFFDGSNRSIFGEAVA